MIGHVILDCDGVLTDGKQYIGPDGRKVFKAFHSRDIKAIRYLVSLGIPVTVVSADDWPGAVAWCMRVGADYIHTRDKLASVLRLASNDTGEYAAVGDDAWDVPVLASVHFPFCPADAEPCVKALDGMSVLPVEGGKGVVAALVNTLTEWKVL